MKLSLCKQELYWAVVILFLIHPVISSCPIPKNRTNHEAGLYSPQDDLNILTVNNFTSTVYKSDRAWLVEFYASWCGDCQRAARHVKAFGTDIKGWNDVVEVAVLNCIIEKNAPVCKHFGITKYPTFRYIHEGYTEGSQNTGIPIIGDSNTHFLEHRRNLIKVLRKEQQEGRGKRFPNLQPFNDSSVSSIFKIANRSLELAFLIKQKSDDDVGPSIIMDYHKVTEVAVAYSYEKSTAKKQLPALYKIQKSGLLQNLKISSPDREGIKIAIRDILLSRHIKVPDEILRNVTEIENETISVNKEELAFTKIIKETGDTVFQLDLENALRDSLTIEVAGNNKIEGDKLDALRKYVYVLERYFPFDVKGKSVLRNIKKYVSSTSIIYGSVIKDFLTDGGQPSRQIFRGPKDWLGCTGSTPTLRGYPCSLWKLFHYLTVNVAFDPRNAKFHNYTLVLEAMHGYIKHFFGCEDCSNHFQEMAKNMNIFDVSSWKESVLWLWRVHNEVNRRLAGDITDDPQFRKIQFPSKKGCPQCYSPDGLWREDEVLSYLKKMYRRRNINHMCVYKQPIQIPQWLTADLQFKNVNYMCIL